MKVLCLADDRRVAYLIKHVLSFEGYGVELGRPGERLDDLARDVTAVVAATSLDDVGPLPVPVIWVDPGVQPEVLLIALRAALAHRDAQAGVWLDGAALPSPGSSPDLAGAAH
jgi:hypothetical protein